MHFNGQEDPVMRLIEELAELQKALCKAERFGWDNHHPHRPERTNRQHVAEEMADVLRTMTRVNDQYVRDADEMVSTDLPS